MLSPHGYGFLLNASMINQTRPTRTQKKAAQTTSRVIRKWFLWELLLLILVGYVFKRMLETATCYSCIYFIKHIKKHILKTWMHMCVYHCMYFLHMLYKLSRSQCKLKKIKQGLVGSLPAALEPVETTPQSLRSSPWPAQSSDRFPPGMMSSIIYPILYRFFHPHARAIKLVFILVCR